MLGSVKNTSTHIKRVIHEPSPIVITPNTVTCLPFHNIVTTGPPVKTSILIDDTLEIKAQIDCGAQANIGGPSFLREYIANRCKNNLSNSNLVYPAYLRASGWDEKDKIL